MALQILANADILLAEYSLIETHAGGIEQIAAIKILKHALTTAPALVQLDYSKGARLIILAVNGYKNRWGYGLMQLDV